MSARGRVLIKSTNDDELITTSSYVKKYLTNPAYAQTGEGILLDDVNSLDTAALIENFPHISWIAFMGDSTEEANTLWVYAGTGVSSTPQLYAMAHVDYIPALGVDTFNKDAGTYAKYLLVKEAIEES